jgi:cob(I)alamin adenosyltransferase
MAKDSARAAAIGDVDEANSALGLALLHVEDETLGRRLRAIQNELFDLGADLATPGEDFAPTEMALRIVQPQIDRLEAEIDAMNEALEPLRSFILPGGSPAAAALHLARAIVRRAERSAVAAGREVKVNPLALVYLNRLSDHLFVAARLAAKAAGGDLLWEPGATRSAD